jgi:NAD(P)-dependent dehydrogenase (short-subunit alcohol dehydrogenase family)
LLKQPIPIKRFEEPEVDLGAIVVFLSSPASDYMTGISITLRQARSHSDIP